MNEKQRRWIKLLRVAQQGSGLVVAIFVSLHLAAPCAAALAGSIAADQTMLITRDLFYHRFEVVVLGSAALHVISSASKRLLLQDGQMAWHSYAGWLLMPLTVMHFATHRALPLRKGLSPHLVSYRLVSWVLQKRTVVGVLQYGALTGLAVYHALSGLRKTFWRGPARLETSNWKALYAGVVATVGLGLARLHRAQVPLWLGARYSGIAFL